MDFDCTLVQTLGKVWNEEVVGVDLLCIAPGSRVVINGGGGWAKGERTCGIERVNRIRAPTRFPFLFFMKATVLSRKWIVV